MAKFGKLCILSEGWLPLSSSEGVGIISSQVFSLLRSFKGWIQTKTCVIPRDVNPVAET